MIIDCLLGHVGHLVAWAATKTVTPERALRLTSSAMGWARIDLATARHTISSLEPWGTCLTRAIAIAARLPRARVVISGIRAERDGKFVGHAWVQLEKPLRNWDVQGDVLAVLQSTW